MKLEGQRILVCGAGGFIGGHLVKTLKASVEGEIRAVDIKPIDEWYQTTDGVENLSLDLQEKYNCYQSTEGIDTVFQLAADMGGMGFIENNRALYVERAHQHSYADGCQGSGSETFLLLLLRVRLQRPKAGHTRRDRIEGGRCLSGPARRRLRLGEAFQRTYVSPL